MATAINNEIEEPTASVRDHLGLLRELLDETDVVVAQRPTKKSRKAAVGIDDMSSDEFKAYKSRLQSERRARLKAQEAAGSLPFDAETTRDALADAALMLLYSGGPGADPVMNYLGKVFADKPGAPLTIAARIRTRALKPKLLRFPSKSS
ncbi:hypothetical protein B5K08_05580 [Rhizobium leguminosarum bv. trifolii]|uniref:Uncharacterized protein n=1 Tax=Rhizobium leguminosarum bv. trifolii TaxID=386 RepID=A0A3E1BY80_RHILT|nr:hypothetical protein [Rhizobium leguminosarum]RFB98020.1 hypothetical protein B5K08_05580 [Rhizobium leguminosarum bv. trifolii]RFB99973.1 hypothetical protein B5K10_05570 [Rhizobium leguminosarum bv. trifolii]